MKKSILFAWLGNADLAASESAELQSVGPIGQAVKERQYTRLILLSNFESKLNSQYVAWLREWSSVQTEVHYKKLSSPTAYDEIYTFARQILQNVINDGERAGEFTFHLSPGTPAMAAVWIILGRTEFPAELIESSLKHGVRTVQFPFEISADFIPTSSKETDSEIEKLTLGLPPEAPEFEQIIHKSDVMKRAVARARRLAGHDVSVLILGESGTGKELMARAVHASSSRKNGPFVPVNCGAIPKELLESEFFGHVKGAFSGAIKDSIGYLQQAHNGTLFLDEIGELPLSAQVKLLRALQDGKFIRVGDSQETSVSVRVISATNKDLMAEVADGRFREDLFHRLAIGVLSLPPLRERHGDINLLIDHFLAEANEWGGKMPGWKDKKTSASARNLIIKHPWRGNVRELKNTITRASIWSTGNIIGKEDVEESLIASPEPRFLDSILNRPLDKGLVLSELVSEVVRHYLERAYEIAGGNKSRAAQLVGLPNYQTFTNWASKHGAKIGTTDA